jgi:hypothetical protein
LTWIKRTRLQENVMKIAFAVLFIATAPAAVFGQNTHVRITNVNPKAATVYESYLRGWADLYRSAGEFYYLRALGAKEAENAREQAIYNGVTAIRAGQNVRRLNRAFQTEQQPKYDAQGVASFQRKLLPARLTSAQLDSDGRIQWPGLLLAGGYRELRHSLEELFRRRAGTVPPEQQAELRGAILNLTSRLNAELKQQIAGYRPAEYIAARKFIDGLRNEARFEGAIYLTGL